jgi:uncharacterized membrane protein SirB2
MSYLALKYTHVTCVIISGCGFLLRGIWMLNDSPWLSRRWVKIAPHMVDTMLLASAIGLALTLEQYPFVHGWLTAKVLGLLAYIGFGMVALRRGRTRGLRTAAWLAALASFLFIVSVALTRDAQGVFTLAGGA